MHTKGDLNLIHVGVEAPCSKLMEASKWKDYYNYLGSLTPVS